MTHLQQLPAFKLRNWNKHQQSETSNGIGTLYASGRTMHKYRIPLGKLYPGCGRDGIEYLTKLHTTILQYEPNESRRDFLLKICTVFLLDREAYRVLTARLSTFVIA
ncbi:hypothetical protein WN51_11726 [Melipona quadrifasciata]|uniref:Uncharacterized protein n=1 Tax=Melipona quadrifasciata TaxID=166423 RepID=A0A0M9A3C0_9HYME|nr:hypothetical protein WN51_11726 [Melipona quadrifasciata]